MFVIVLQFLFRNNRELFSTRRCFAGIQELCPGIPLNLILILDIVQPQA